MVQRKRFILSKIGSSKKKFTNFKLCRILSASHFNFANMKRSSLSSILKWNLGSIAHDIPNIMGKEHVDPYYAPMLYYSLEKWKEFKKVLFSKTGNCHMTIGQVKAAFIARGHTVSGDSGNRFYVMVKGRRFLVEKKFGKRYFTISNEMFFNGGRALAPESEIKSSVSVPRFVEYIEMYTEMLDCLPDVLRAATTLNNKNTKIAAITLPYIKVKLDESGVLDGVESRIIQPGDHVAIVLNFSKDERRKIILTEDNIDDVIRLLPTALDDVENFDFYFPAERFIIQTL